MYMYITLAFTPRGQPYSAALCDNLICVWQQRRAAVRLRLGVQG